MALLFLEDHVEALIQFIIPEMGTALSYLDIFMSGQFLRQFEII